MISAKVIADSIWYSPLNRHYRLTTLELCYPRFIHSEFMTHRVFSRNAMSSRAVPVAKMIEQVRSNPAMPIHWGINRPGMQATEQLPDGTEAEQQWRYAAHAAANQAEQLAALGLHKQVVNRVLEPYQWMRTIVSATEWANFFELRCHPDAQPEFQALAQAIRTAIDDSAAVTRHDRGAGLTNVEWHLPYVSQAERDLYRADLLPKLSAARCARVSYLNHDGTDPDVEADLALFKRLVGSEPLHASPIEHQAIPTAGFHGNFVGWKQYRQIYRVGQ